MCIEQRWPFIYQQLTKVSPNTSSVEVLDNTIVINGLQLTSNYDRRYEAQLQTEHISPGHNVVYLFGPGFGDVQSELIAKKVHSIVVCILNYETFFHSLCVLEQKGWLENPSIQLVSPEQIHYIDQAFVALPAELNLAAAHATKLRDKVMLELDKEYQDLSHSAANNIARERLELNKEFVKEDADVSELFSNNYQKVYIAAAGPTLANHFELLKQVSQDESCLLFSLDATVKTLIKQNIKPDLVISVDQNNTLLFHQVDLSVVDTCPLVYFPRVEHDFIKSWRGKRYCAYSQGELFDDIDKEIPRTRLFTGGSVIHPAVDIAVKMGAKDIILLGADFGFPGNRTYADDDYSSHTADYSTSGHWVRNGRGDNIPTMLNYRGYLRELERYIASKSFVNFYNGSLEGAHIEGTEPLK